MPVSAELLYPISWGGSFEYPYAGRSGISASSWIGSVPRASSGAPTCRTSERYCTYRQTFTYVWNHADFLTDADRRAIFRDNTLALFRR